MVLKEARCPEADHGQWSPLLQEERVDPERSKSKISPQLVSFEPILIKFFLPTSLVSDLLTNRGRH